MSRNVEPGRGLDATGTAARGDERALMSRLHEGSPEALAALFDDAAPILYSLAFRIVGSRERASCVLEDLFEEIWRDREAGRVPGIPMIAWIARCRELALDQRGPESRRPMTEDRSLGNVGGIAAGNAGGATGSISSGTVVPHSEPGAERLAPEPDRLTPASLPRAREALEALPERDRQALEEAYFCGENAREIATRVGSPTTEAESMLRSALVRFRTHLAEAPADAAREASP